MSWAGCRVQDIKMISLGEENDSFKNAQAPRLRAELVQKTLSIPLHALPGD